jgi:outer membrane protein, multidrug efflux system
MTTATRLLRLRPEDTVAVTLDFAPTVTFVGGYTRQRLSGSTFPIGSGVFPDQDILDAGLDASWELDLFGRVRRNVQAQGAFLGVTQEDLRNIRVTLAAELARSGRDHRQARDGRSSRRRQHCRVEGDGDSELR